MRRRYVLVLAAVAAFVTSAFAAVASSGHTGAALPLPRPAWSDAELISTGTAPPTQAQCFAVGRRCFTPATLRASYNVGPLYALGLDGRGQTIAIVDAYGSDTMAHDLHVFDQAFGLPPMCGEEGVACSSGMPTFSQLALQGSPATKAQPGKGTHLEDKSAWALEVALDLETAHAIAPGANILLVHTPTAETLGVQGFPQMMAAEDYVVTHHLASVISMSLAAGEPTFASTRALENLRYAFKDAAANGVSVLGASGDSGSAVSLLQPVGQGGAVYPSPAVEWPASDPLVTGIGGTSLCTDPFDTVGRVADTTDPPGRCGTAPGVAEQTWIGSGGGFSQIFGRPAYQDVLPAGSTPIPQTMRGVPDVALQASPATGYLVYVSLPPDGNGSNVNDTGWYDIGGTSLATPQWAGLVSIAAQLNGGGLGLLNPALYELGSNPARYANDFYDITFGTNTIPGIGVPGYPATPGWDPVTGLGTPNAANLIPDLVAVVHGS